MTEAAQGAGAHRVDEVVQHQDTETPARPASPLSRILLAVGILVVGGVVLQQGLAVPGALEPSGPRLFPTVLGVLTLLLGVIHLVQVLRDVRARSSSGAEGISHGARLALLAALLVVYAYLLFPLGYVLATSLLFGVAATVLGSSHRVRDAVIGVLLSVGVYLVFSQLLGISLPRGVIPL